MTTEDQALQALLQEAGVADVAELPDDTLAERELRALFDATAPAWTSGLERRLAAADRASPGAAREEGARDVQSQRVPRQVATSRPLPETVWPGRSVLALVAALFLSVGLLSWLPRVEGPASQRGSGAERLADRGAEARPAATVATAGREVADARALDELRVEQDALTMGVDDPLAGLGGLGGLGDELDVEDVAAAGAVFGGVEAGTETGDAFDGFGVDLLDTGSI